MIQGRVETQCVFLIFCFFCKICKGLFLFPDVCCCLTFYLQQRDGLGFGGVRGGGQFVQILKKAKKKLTNTSAGLVCRVALTVGGKPFKATSSCNCCRDFSSRTDDDKHRLFIV